MRSAASFTICHTAFSVRLSPHVVPPLTLRSSLPPSIAAATSQSSLVRFSPIRNRNGSDVASLAQEIDDDPVFFPLLKMTQGQCDHFMSSQPAREHESQQSAVSFAFEPLAIRSLPKRLSLFCSQPVAKTNA